jgi:hypothetical protein
MKIEPVTAVPETMPENQSARKSILPFRGWGVAFLAMMRYTDRNAHLFFWRRFFSRFGGLNERNSFKGTSP